MGGTSRWGTTGGMGGEGGGREGGREGCRREVWRWRGREGEVREEGGREGEREGENGRYKGERKVFIFHAQVLSSTQLPVHTHAHMFPASPGSVHPWSVPGRTP